MKSVILILFLFSCIPSSAQNLKKEAALEDLNFLVNKVEEYNPALQNYQPEFKSLALDVIAGVTTDTVLIFDYFTRVSKICALANEGHFTLGDWDDIAHKGIMDNSVSYLPVSVKLISGRLYVLEDYSNEQHLSKGDEIVSINGLKTEVVLNELLECIPSDGNIKTYAYRKIEDGFSWFYLFYIQQTDEFDIEYLDSENRKAKVRLKALIRSDQVDNYKKYCADNIQKPSKKETGFYDLNYSNKYAILTLPSFDYRRVNKYDVKSKKLYKAIFRELQEKNIEHLIIDLRDNTGGRNEFADDMIPFIMKPLNDDDFLKKTVSWKGKEKTYKLPKPSKLAFKGEIYVLVNGKTYSAGSSLARFLKEYGNATIIGTETGTRYEGFAAGSLEDVILPNSQIRIGIPRYHIIYPKSDKQTTVNHGLLPDYEINCSFDEYSTGRDLHLEKAISIIEKIK